MRTALLLIALPLAAQTMRLPKVLITGGAGFASPNGKFAYASESSLLLPQNTYTTIAWEDTIIKGQVQSCTLAGVSKPLYQFGWTTVGLTGLGGGCTSTTGAATGTMSGQAFLHVGFGTKPWGVVFTAVKNSSGGFKATIGLAWSQSPQAPAAAALAPPLSPSQVLQRIVEARCAIDPEACPELRAALNSLSQQKGQK